MMICLGNICRSPLAHGILEAKVKAKGLGWSVDSSGTSGWHEGEKPDSRSIEVAKENDLDISYQRSQKFVRQHVEDFDLLITMDASNYRDVIALCNSETEKSKVKMLMNYRDPGKNEQVPDPYYHGGFPYVYKMIEEAIDALITYHT